MNINENVKVFVELSITKTLLLQIATTLKVIKIPAVSKKYAHIIYTQEIDNANAIYCSNIF